MKAPEHGQHMVCPMPPIHENINHDDLDHQADRKWHSYHIEKAKMMIIDIRDDLLKIIASKKYDHCIDHAESNVLQVMGDTVNIFLLRENMFRQVKQQKNDGYRIGLNCFNKMGHTLYFKHAIFKYPV